MLSIFKFLHETNKLNIKCQLYAKSRKIATFRHEICLWHNSYSDKSFTERKKELNSTLTELQNDDLM